jgi:hypothetical protein
VALLPLVLSILSALSPASDVVSVDQIDDAPERAAGVALLATPFLYLIGIPTFLRYLLHYAGGLIAQPSIGSGNA